MNTLAAETTALTHCRNVSCRAVSGRAGAARCDVGILRERHLERLVLPLSPSVHGKHLRPDRGARNLRRVRPRALPPKGELGGRPSILVLFPGAVQALASVRRRYCAISLANEQQYMKGFVCTCESFRILCNGLPLSARCELRHDR